MTFLAELPGLPRAALTVWLARELPELSAGSDWTAEVITGGLSNITYRLTVGAGTVVLRRPPLAGVVPSAHDMVREHRVQQALAQTGLPVPKPLALCVDPDVIGSPFYVMADVAGKVLRNARDTAALTPDDRTAVTHALVEALADLHHVDYSSVGLAEFGYPQGYCDRQVRRWAQQWARTATRDLPDMGTLLQALNARIPARSENAIVHGDYRLDNTILDLAGPAPRIAAILDWELSTLGDPLADLGLFLTYWHDGQLGDDVAFAQTAGLTSHDGFPAAAQVAQLYAARTGRDLSDLAFYRALGTMKLAVILEGVHARYLGGQTISPGYESVGAAVPVLAARALALLGEG